VNVIEVIQWRDGKAAHSWVFMNGLEPATQLGLVK